MARTRVLIVSGSSVVRALLSSLLNPEAFAVAVADSLPVALRQVASTVPHATIVQADIVRASPDALDRLRAAAGARIGVVLADRGYGDERRAASEVASLGAGAGVPVPTDADTLVAALQAATASSGRRPSTPAMPPGEVPEPHTVDAGQAARYAERLAAKIESMDAYQVLRVRRGATQAEIDSAFRQRALEVHPDRQHDVPDDATREHLYRIFKRVSWALRQIGDPVARRLYDAALEQRR